MSYAENKERLAILQAQLDAITNGTANCFPMASLWYILVPVIIFLILFFLRPGIVKKQENGKAVRSNKKVFGWTIVLTIIIWLLIFAYYKFRPGDTWTEYCPVSLPIPST